MTDTQWENVNASVGESPDGIPGEPGIDGPVTDRPDYQADIIDSRDLLERLDDLEAADTLDEDESAELAMLRALRAETEGYSESWRDGVAFIADRHFVEYAQDLAEDIGAIGPELQWPLYAIDWEYAARELRMDYTACEIDGRDYWYR